MTTDITLTILFIVFSSLMAYLGLRVAFYPAESSRAKRIYQVTFLICMFIACTVGGIQTYRGGSIPAALDSLKGLLSKIDRNTQNQAKIVTVSVPTAVSDRQMQEPEITIDPFLKGSFTSKPPGKFEVTAHNEGVSDVRELSVYADSFAGRTQYPLTLRILGPLPDRPDATIDNLPGGHKKQLTIDLSRSIPALYDDRDNWHKYGNIWLNVMRLRLTYRRNADGKDFVSTIDYQLGVGPDYINVVPLKEPRSIDRTTLVNPYSTVHFPSVPEIAEAINRMYYQH